MYGSWFLALCLVDEEPVSVNMTGFPTMVEALQVSDGLTQRPEVRERHFGPWPGRVGGTCRRERRLRAPDRNRQPVAECTLPGRGPDQSQMPLMISAWRASLAAEFASYVAIELAPKSAMAPMFAACP